MGTKDVENHGKKGLEIKDTHGYIQYADAWKKSPFLQNRLRLDLIFLKS